ncbi:MAG: iron ABC transporter permease [Gammaproteobacteria bacterium]|jgi:iron(III) transport system permease protein|nr:iron ABC transporter permease [Gammaproteobacteria bacterium]MBT3722020.1 iron ABC transporter permease [Gammaproteobacteria bacterium]MBT4194985.1 iron ABC transporter permease [Gammaproteobacteria bacterium]MBT4449473.1 iron ABC transporter permease [Gammaproteobacteria bacterium]MBT4862458.1 iron ABC transporter permease [Gammaproteobacteria bacterium]
MTSKAYKNPGQTALFFFIALFLLSFLIIPVVKVFYVAFIDVNTGNLTFINFVDFFNTSLFMESFYNSFYVAAMSVLLATLISLPLAYFTTRFEFKGSIIIQSLGFVPLIMPPFVGAVAMQLLFGSNGSINLLMDEYFGFTIPFMEGLNGVIFVQSLHYFPFILINLSASLNNIDRSMEESAQNLGSSGMRLFRRIVFPLAMPGYVAGASLVFIKVFDDLGTPLLLNVNNMLAPQAYLRISSIGIDDPMGYVIAVILVIFSLFAMWIASLALKGKDYSTVQKGGGGLAKRKMRPMERLIAYFIVIFILLTVLSPHFGLTMLSFGTIWSYSILPDGFTPDHYVEIFSETPEFMMNTLLYASLAASIDIILGTSIAYLVLRTKIRFRHWLDYAAMAALAVPGLVLGIGYLRTFLGASIPFGDAPLATWWVMLVIALSIRRLPYALRACTSALQQVSRSLEEAAENLGANKAKTIQRIVLPLMSGGLLAGFVTSFATAAVELSATIMLVSTESDAPLAYGIYVFMQSAAGRGPGAALGMVAVLIVGLGTYFSHRIIEKGRLERSLESNHK